MSDAIQFFNEETDFSLNNQNQIIDWITSVAENHDYKIEGLNYVLCSDDYLLQINKDHLNHHYYTDIITFDLSEEDHSLEGDIFVSIDRVKENALANNIEFNQELYRVLIHGVLHLIGFNDKTEEERRIMRIKEDSCLSLLLEN